MRRRDLLRMKKKKKEKVNRHAQHQMQLREADISDKLHFVRADSA
jgi:hypothetical protein